MPEVAPEVLRVAQSVTVGLPLAHLVGEADGCPLAVAEPVGDAGAVAVPPPTDTVCGADAGAVLLFCALRVALGVTLLEPQGLSEALVLRDAEMLPLGETLRLPLFVTLLLPVGEGDTLAVTVSCALRLASAVPPVPQPLLEIEGPTLRVTACDKVADAVGAPPEPDRAAEKDIAALRVGRDVADAFNVGAADAVKNELCDGRGEVVMVGVGDGHEDMDAQSLTVAGPVAVCVLLPGAVAHALAQPDGEWLADKLCAPLLAVPCGEMEGKARLGLAFEDADAAARVALVTTDGEGSREAVMEAEGVALRLVLTVVQKEAAGVDVKQELDEIGGDAL